MIEQLIQLGSVGLIYDGVGVVVLGFAFFLKSVKEMMVESGAYWDGNDALLQSLIHQRTDGVVGTSLLLVGFLLQLLGTLGMQCKLAGELLLVFLAAGCVAYVLYLRKKLIAIQVARSTALKQQATKQT